MEKHLWERFLTLACDKVMAYTEKNVQTCLNNAWWAGIAPPLDKNGEPIPSGERDCFVIAWNIEATYCDNKYGE